MDSTGVVGQFASLALDSSGNPHISYYDKTNMRLKYASWSGSEWNIQTVDGSGSVGEYTSLALDSNNNPRISYYDMGNNALKYAAWSNNKWDIQTVDSANAGEYTCLALDSHGNPCISYFSETNGTVKYAQWTGAKWNIETVVVVGPTSELTAATSTVASTLSTSFALDSSDNPHISYNDYTDGSLKYAVRSGTDWKIEVVASAGMVSWFSSLVLGNDGNPQICYYGLNLKYASWSGTSWVVQNVDSSPTAGYYASLAVDKSGNRHISYFAAWGDLKYATWTGSSWDVQTVEVIQGPDVWPQPSTCIALDSAGAPHIAYCDSSKGDLKYASLGSPLPPPTTEPPSTTAPPTSTAPATAPPSVSPPVTESPSPSPTNVVQNSVPNYTLPIVAGVAAGAAIGVGGFLLMKRRGTFKPIPPHHADGSSLGHIFVCHVEEDQKVATEIAEGLEKAGYKTWYYERDSIPGESYLKTEGHAIQTSKAVLVVLSDKSLRSNEIDVELSATHKAGKRFIPVLTNISYDEFQHRRPEWALMLGTSTSVSINKGGVTELIPRLIAGIAKIDGVKKDDSQPKP